MEEIRIQLKKPITSGVIGFILGVFIGLVVFGWWLFPIEWKDGAARDLREDAKSDYLRMTIDSYILRKDALQAKMRWDELEPGAEQMLAAIQSEEGKSAAEKKAIGKFNEIVQAASLSTDEGLPLSDTQPKQKSQGVGWLLVVFIVIVLGGVAAAVIYFIRGNPRRGTPEQSDDNYEDEAYPSGHSINNSYEEVALSGRKRETKRSDTKDNIPKREEAPIAQFITTFTLGDDLYDDSFSIDSPSGEFLGECGVGISQTIGVGEPKKATAFELWLFDKNDIQTVTKVLMTQHAFHDIDIKQSLIAKGEPILVEPGREIMLETATLALLARVVDMAYGSGPLPPKSYIERITLDLQLFRKK